MATTEFEQEVERLLGYSVEDGLIRHRRKVLVTRMFYLDIGGVELKNAGVWVRQMEIIDVNRFLSMDLKELEDRMYHEFYGYMANQL